MSEKRKRLMLFTLTTIGFGIAHFAVSFFVSFGAGIGGGPVMNILSKILTFPLWLLPGGSADEEQTLAMWWPWALLSLGWGAGITALLRAITKL